MDDPANSYSYHPIHLYRLEVVYKVFNRLSMMVQAAKWSMVSEVLGLCS